MIPATIYKRNVEPAIRALAVRVTKEGYETPGEDVSLTFSYPSLMSRAFIKEDAGGPERRFSLPPRDDPGFDAAAAMALLEGANVGDSYSVELVTGYSWGEPTLRPHVQRILDDAKAAGNERLAQLAERFLSVPLS